MKLITLEQRKTTQKTALHFLLDAWDEALANGIESDTLATAALFTALSALVDNHGEEAVIALTERLAQRIEKGEFSIDHVTH